LTTRCLRSRMAAKSGFMGERQFAGRTHPTWHWSLGGTDHRFTGGGFHRTLSMSSKSSSKQSPVSPHNANSSHLAPEPNYANRAMWRIECAEIRFMPILVDCLVQALRWPTNGTRLLARAIHKIDGQLI